MVHYFDVETRRIACGVAGLERSTKHVRGVTCPACLELLRRAHAEPAAEHAAP
jgi:hypothetical protein